jgi:hypothetical protein
MGSPAATYARYSVEFQFERGNRDVVSVWETDPAAAMQAAREWLLYSQDYPTDGAVKVTVERLGAESEPGDIGIAGMNDEVNHRRYSRDGDPVHTTWRVELDEIHRLTAALRSSPDGNWPVVRSLLHERGVSPDDVAAIGAWEWRDERPQQLTMVTSDGQILMFADGSSPIEGPAGPPTRPASIERAPYRYGERKEPRNHQMEAGIRLLRERGL